MTVANCIECDAEIELSDRPRLGQKIICHHCSAQLEVVSTNPVDLDWAYDDDWDDEGEDFGDEEADFDEDFDDDDDDFDDTDEEPAGERWR